MHQSHAVTGRWRPVTARARAGPCGRAALVLALAACAASPAWADDPPPAALGGAPGSAAAPAPSHELGILPLAGGDTDDGIGVGAIGSFARLAPGFKPYKWKLEFAGFYATKSGLFSPSYEDAYALFTAPQLVHQRLRLEVRASYTKETTLKFFGLGDAAVEPATLVATRDYYVRVHPSLSVDTTWTLRKPWRALFGAQYTYDRISTDPTSTLAVEAQSTDPLIQRALAIVPRHSVVRLEAAAVYDTRDNEVSPTNGQYHMLKLRDSPAIGANLPYGYRQLDAQARFYYTPIPRYLTLTARGVFDVQTGSPPFYELARYEETSAIGGSLGVRGVPAYSFYGKVKTFANFEARNEPIRFTWFGKHIALGFAAFFDAGRLWTDPTIRRSDLDGTGLGLHYGVGGGLRLREGKTFIVRGDIAWSPDARPVGAYLLANQIF